MPSPVPPSPAPAGPAAQPVPPATDAPEPGAVHHGVFVERGLVIPLLPPGVHWVPLLTPDGRPICVAMQPDGRWLDWRPLPAGESPESLEDELHDKLDAHLRRARSGLTLVRHGGARDGAAAPPAP